MYGYNEAFDAIRQIKGCLSSVKIKASYHVVGMADVLIDVLG